MAKTNSIDDMDEIRLGINIYMWRNKLGLTQKELADQVGITFQQIQKYESADNHISAIRLLRIARALDVPVYKLFNEEYIGPALDKPVADAICALYKMPTPVRKYILRAIKRMSENK